ncbi:MAG: hypothetical protein JWP81_636 [Ferruginibacter sp.]|nr:hypothetical protein [Ferruginibacter sp.]
MNPFNLKEEILREHSKAQCNKITEWVGDSQTRFDELFDLFLHSEYRVTQRAAWPLSYCVNTHPYFIEKRFAELLGNLSKAGLHNAIKRNTLRILQNLDIPEKHQGEVMHICFQYVELPTEAVAIKAFALTILGKLAKLYPEIVPEIRLLIEEQLPHQTAAFKNRANRLLKVFG